MLAFGLARSLIGGALSLRIIMYVCVSIADETRERRLIMRLQINIYICSSNRMIGGVSRAQKREPGSTTKWHLCDDPKARAAPLIKPADVTTLTLLLKMCNIYKHINMLHVRQFIQPK